MKDIWVSKSLKDVHEMYYIGDIETLVQRCEIFQCHRYPEFTLLSGTTTVQIIVHTKAILACHGIPMTVISDNGQQFSSQCCKDFEETYGFEHITSSPLYPQP